MRKRTVLLLAALWAAPVLANHPGARIDLCNLYPERMPPGLAAAQLPEPATRAAHLLEHYCIQCHKLPGPGQHTASEWPDTVTRMQNLMQVASRFGALLGSVQAPTTAELSVIQAYLSRHALHATAQTPAGFGSGTFQTLCADCHALPDPAQHRAEDWTAVVARMSAHAPVMRRKAPTQEQLVQVLAYLQSHADAQAPRVTQVATAPIAATPPTVQRRGGRWLALGPFFGLALFGVVRWRRAERLHKDD
jgi:cytochrome c5